jgi:hypothetical protein
VESHVVRHGFYLGLSEGCRLLCSSCFGEIEIEREREREKDKERDFDARINTTRLTTAKNLQFFVKPCFKMILLEYFNEKRKRL